MGSFLWNILQNLFEYCKYVDFNFHDSNIATAKFLVISAETTCWEIEKIAKFNEDFYLPLYVPSSMAYHQEAEWASLQLLKDRSLLLFRQHPRYTGCCFSHPSVIWKNFIWRRLFREMNRAFGLHAKINPGLRKSQGRFLNFTDAPCQFIYFLLSVPHPMILKGRTKWEKRGVRKMANFRYWYHRRCPCT
jgi:hypothetical protein